MQASEGEEGGQGRAWALFPGGQGPISLQVGHGPQVGDTGERVARAPMHVAEEGPRVLTVGVCRPLCIIQLVNCSRPVAAERATERVVLLFMMKRRGACRGLEWAERRAGWTAN